MQRALGLVHGGRVCKVLGILLKVVAGGGLRANQTDAWIVTVPVGVVAYDVHFVYSAAPVSATTYLAGWTGVVTTPPPPAPPAAEFSTSTHPLQGGSDHGPFYVERPDDAKLETWYFTDKKGRALLLSNNGCVPRDWPGAISLVEGQQAEQWLTVLDPEPVTTLTWSSSGFPSWAQLDPATGRCRLRPRAGDAGLYPVTVTVSDAGSPPLGAGLQITLAVEQGARIVDGSASGPAAVVEVDPGSFLEEVLGGTCLMQLERSEDLLGWSGPIPWVRLEHGRLIFEDVAPWPL